MSTASALSTASSLSTATLSTASLETITLLLVDDHQMLRQSLRRSLEEEHFVVLGEASDGEEGVRLAAELRPNVVLMDVSMPEMDGVTATRHITAAVPGVKVVMLTMHPDEDVLAKALAAGAAGYLVKDCSIEEVATTVRQAVANDIDLSSNVARSMLAQVKTLGPNEDGADPISPREVEVLQLIADGLSTPEVAGQLYISQKTVKNHLASIYGKLDARDRTQAVITAVRMGIVKLF
jgi:two-component system, NarL family, response regulator DegU